MKKYIKKETSDLWTASFDRQTTGVLVKCSSVNVSFHLAVLYVGSAANSDWWFSIFLSLFIPPPKKKTIFPALTGLFNLSLNHVSIPH